MTPAGSPWAPTPLRVAGVARETADTVTLRVDASGREELLAARPGQFAMLYVFGVGEVPISLSAVARGRLHLTVRAAGAATAAIVRTRRGGVLGVRGPFGRGWPLELAAGRDVLLVAGGLGLAPLRPALEALLRRRRLYGRVMLIYGTRTPDTLLFRRDLARWGARADLELRLTVDRGGPGWSGDVGVVPALLPRLGLDPDRTLAWICGPEVMMRFTVRELRRLGLPDERLHLSLERNMHCAIGLCGHCQLGPHFVCKDGPVLPAAALDRWMLARREL